MCVTLGVTRNNKSQRSLQYNVFNPLFQSLPGTKWLFFIVHYSLNCHLVPAGKINRDVLKEWCRFVLVACSAPRYNYSMIKHFKHKGLRLFFETGSKSGIRPDHAARLARQLRQLHDSRSIKEMNMPGWKLHPLAGELADHWSVTVNGNWRMTFTFEGEDAILVDYQDYH
jgi:proteic killer suppression protein